MHTDADHDRRSAGKDDLFRITLLLFAALVLGLYHIAATGLIAKDGVTFIDFARGLATAPTKAIAENDQHPGYPALIAAAHALVGRMRPTSGLQGWILAAQGTALVSRLLALVVLYYVAKTLVGPWASFWAVIVLMVLPDPAKYGSDALSDWPHMALLSLGLLCLLHGARRRQWWLFGLAGLIAGAGFLVRPECAQLVVYGLAWLIVSPFMPKHRPRIASNILAAVVLIAAFAVVAGPYIKLKGAVFPKKRIGRFSSTTVSLPAQNAQHQPVACRHLPGHARPAEGSHACASANMSPGPYRAALLPPNTPKALHKYVSNICETVLYYFLPFMLVGLFVSLRARGIAEPETFLMILFILLNTACLMWLYTVYGYMDRRHTMPLVLLLALYTPAGLKVIATWLGGKTEPGQYPSLLTVLRPQWRWFVILTIVGIVICAPKLLRPMRTDKRAYKQAAAWLRENCGPDDLVLVPDMRIGLYAQREYLVAGYETGQQPTYIVTIADRPGESMKPDDRARIVYSVPLRDKDKGREILILRNEGS